MREGQALEARAPGRARAARAPAKSSRAGQRAHAEEAHQHHVLDATAAPARISATRSASSCALAAVAVAVGGEQHLGLDLAEAVEHAAHAEVGRARGPDRAERRRGEHRDDRLGAVRQDAGDAIAGAHAHRAQLRGERARPARAAPPTRARARAPSSPRKISAGRGVVAAQQVLGVVEPRSGEEARAGHAVVDQPGRGRRARRSPRRSPRPRARTPRARPPTSATDRCSSAKRRPVVSLDARAERAQLRALDARRRRRPERARLTRAPRSAQPAPHQLLGDLHGVGRRALAQVVADDPEPELVARQVAADRARRTPRRARRASAGVGNTLCVGSSITTHARERRERARAPRRA